jgi:uncharacterized protein YecE (DUF72 family)
LRDTIACNVRVLVGTSGYSYPEWKGSFYPADLPASKMLPFYAERFATVELNHTFYRMPTEKALAQAAAQVPPSFLFAVKAPQRITHKERLEGSRESLGFFSSACAALGERRGPTLFQLPPFLKKDLPRLRAFTAELEPASEAAFEFRHPSWFDDEVYQLLKEAKCALVTSESEKLTVPLEATAPFGYLRLRREDYSERDLADWAARILAQPWSRAYVYFKHEDGGLGPRFAETLVKQLQADR